MSPLWSWIFLFLCRYTVIGVKLTIGGQVISESLEPFKLHDEDPKQWYRYSAKDKYSANTMEDIERADSMVIALVNTLSGLYVAFISGKPGQQWKNPSGEKRGRVQFTLKCENNACEHGSIAQWDDPSSSKPYDWDSETFFLSNKRGERFDKYHTETTDGVMTYRIRHIWSGCCTDGLMFGPIIADFGEVFNLTAQVQFVNEQIDQFLVVTPKPGAVDVTDVNEERGGSITDLVVLTIKGEETVFGQPPVTEPVEGTDWDGFYPWGKKARTDFQLPPADEEYVKITIKSKFQFFKKKYSELFIEINGIISFINPTQQYLAQKPPSSAYPAIFPFWSDVDTSSGPFESKESENTNTIYYHVYETYEEGPDIFDRANKDIQSRFSLHENFEATWVLVVTYYCVDYHDPKSHAQGFDAANTFQVVLITDGTNSFVIYKYAFSGITWTTGDDFDGINGYPAINDNIAVGALPHCGFDNGDGKLYYRHPYSSVLVPGTSTPAMFNLAGESYYYQVHLEKIQEDGEIPAPVVFDITEKFLSSSGGDIVTLSGYDFVEDHMNVKVGGEECRIVESSSTEIQCTLPAGGGNPVVNVQTIIGNKAPINMMKLPDFQIDLLFITTSQPNYKDSRPCISLNNPGRLSTDYWSKNYLCTSDIKANILASAKWYVWSEDNPTQRDNEKCVQILPPNCPNIDDKYCDSREDCDNYCLEWKYVYLCLPKNAPYNLNWNIDSDIHDQKCVAFDGNDDPLWIGNTQLCSKLDEPYPHDSLTYPYGIPEINSVSPLGGPTENDGSIYIILEGKNFGSRGFITIGENECPYESYNDTTIVCELPDGDGSVQIRLEISGQLYTYHTPFQYDGPQIIDVYPDKKNVPTEGQIIISGINFGYLNGMVLLDGIDWQIVTWNTSHIICRTKGMGIKKILQVVDRFDVRSDPVLIDFAPPNIAAINPNTGPSVGGQEIIITGINFGTYGTIMVGDSVCVLVGSGYSQTRLSCLLPQRRNGNLQTRVTVTVAGQRSNQWIFTYSAPILDSLNPLNGYTGTYLTIAGSNFGPGLEVYFGTTVGSILAQDWNSITCVVPATPDNPIVSLTVRSSDGIASNTKTFTFKPVITNFYPIGGKTQGGYTVTLYGSGFAQDMKVSHGDNDALLATDIVVEDRPQMIKYICPAGSGTGVEVKVYSQESSLNSNIISFGYNQPTLLYLSPQTAYKDDWIEVVGADLGAYGEQLAFFGAIQLASNQIEYVDHSRIKIRIPDSSGTNIPIYLQVNYQQSAYKMFSYKGPWLNSIYPSNAKEGEKITLKGIGFGPNFKSKNGLIHIGPTAVTADHANHTCIIFTLPAGEGNQAVSVVPSDNIRSNNLDFSYNGPTITSISTVGKKMTIVGTSFRFVSVDSWTGSVLVGDEICEVLQESTPPDITCTIPEGYGKVPVVVKYLEQTSTEEVFYNYPHPNIVSIDPSDRGTQGGYAITINGNDFGQRLNFERSWYVKIDGQNCNVDHPDSSWMSTKIVCIVGAGQGQNLQVNVTLNNIETSKPIFSYDGPEVDPFLSQIPTVGGTILLKGKNFGTDANVKIKTMSVNAIKNWQGHKFIECQIPPGVGKISNEIEVGGQSSSSFDLSYLPPRIKDIEPRNNDGIVEVGTGGGLITLHGDNFGIFSSSTHLVNLNSTEISSDESVRKPYEHQKMIINLPPGIGISYLDMIVGNQAAVDQSGKNFSKNDFRLQIQRTIPSITSVGCDTVDMRCERDSEVDVTIIGDNFGPNPTGVNVIIGDKVCVVSSSNITHIVCRRPKNSLGGALSIALSVGGFASDHEATLIYNGPSITPGTLKEGTLPEFPPSNTRNILSSIETSSVIAFSGKAWGESHDPIEVILDKDRQKISVDTTITRNDQDLYDHLTCNFPHGMGQKLSYVVVISLNDGKLTSLPSEDLISFSAPSLVDNSIRLKLNETGTGRVVAFSQQTKVFFEVENIGVTYDDVANQNNLTNGLPYDDVTKWLTVKYGRSTEKGIDDVYSLDKTCGDIKLHAYGNKVVLSCMTDVGTGEDYRFQLIGFMGDDSQVVSKLSNFNFSYPQAPVITQVTGCSKSCPTAGGIKLTIEGTNFLLASQSTVRVGGRLCLNLQRVDENFECMLPIGVGCPVGIVVSNKIDGGDSGCDAIVSETNTDLCYSGAEVTSLKSTECMENSLGLINCPLSASDVDLTIYGKNFGVEIPTILVGGKKCANVSCEASCESATYVRCSLPPGLTQGRSVQILQSDGLLTTSQLTISHKQCEPGQFLDIIEENCTACEPGEYTNQAGATICSVCERGKYANEHGASMCFQCDRGMYSKIDDLGKGPKKCEVCPEGQFANIKGLRECILCDVGEYADKNESEKCKPCSQGKSQYQIGQTKCESCPDGKYMPNVRGITCLLCPLGKESSVDGIRCNDCDAGWTTASNNPNERKCTQCSKGKYRNLGDDDQCKYCPMGQFGNETGLGSCYTCPKGFYSQIKTNDQTGPTMCQPCEVGSFGDSSGQSSCQVAPKGTFCQFENQTEPEPCPVGKYSKHLGASICIACPIGMFAFYESTVDCVSCPPGKYSNDTKGAQNCQNCPTGRIQPFSRKEGCEDCPAGKYIDSVGQAGCLVCDMGEFNNESRSTKCEQCPKGQYRNCDDSEIQCDSKVCQQCEPGKFGAAKGLLRCEECETGRYAENNGTTDICTLCPSGKASDRTGSSQCSICIPGRFTSDMGQIHCKLCPRGKYNSNYKQIKCDRCQKGFYQNEDGQSDCLSAPPGGFCETLGQTGFSLCPPGHFTNETNGTKCEPCPPGSVQEREGQTFCHKCEKGMYIDLYGQPICHKCNSGQYTGSEGMTKPSKCFPGKYQPNPGNSNCNDCTKGMYSETYGSAKCHLCPPGHHSLTDGASQCIPCESGEYQEKSGKSSCNSCVEGTSNSARGQPFCPACESGQFGSKQKQDTCDPCPRGKYSLKTPNSPIGRKSCTPCPVGKYSATEGQIQCSPCTVGKYASERGSFQCLECGIGQFTNLTNQRQCQGCDEGRFSSWKGAIHCRLCDPGQFQKNIGQTADKCQPCDKGRYAGSYGSKKCLDCPTGKYQDAKSMSTCVACEEGKFSNLNGSYICDRCQKGRFMSDKGAVECIHCGLGKFQDDKGQKECKSCDIGKIANEAGASDCKKCERNEYQEDRGQTQCLPCGLGEDSDKGSAFCSPCAQKYFRSYSMKKCKKCPGSSIPNDELSSCYCDIGYAFQDHGNNSLVCKKCPEGAVCDRKGTIWLQMRTKVGWSGVVKKYSAKFYRCLEEKHCPGGTDKTLQSPEMIRQSTTTTSTSNENNEISYTSPCAENRAGALCAHCIPGYTPDSFSGKCMFCGDRSISVFKAIVIIILLAILLFLIYYYIDKWGYDMVQLSRIEDEVRTKVKSGYTSHEEYDLADRRTRFKRLVVLSGTPPAKPNATFKFKIALGFMQICTNLSIGLSIRWPETFREFLAFWNFANFDIIQGTNPGCLIKYNFWVKLWMLCIMPFFALLFLVLFFLIPLYRRADTQGEGGELSEKEVHEDKKSARQRFLRLAIFTLFLIYPQVSSIILRTYVCREIQGINYLAADLRILGSLKCYDAEWYLNAIPCIAMVLIYPIGIPVFFFILLWRKKLRLTQSGVRAEIGFLYDAYEHDMWYFEMLDMTHKLILVSLIAFVPVQKGNEMGLQMPVAMIVVLIYLLVILLNKPYIRKGDDRLHILCQAELVLLLMAGHIFNNLINPDPIMDIVLSVIMISIFLLFMMTILFASVHAIRKWLRETPSTKATLDKVERWWMSCPCVSQKKGNKKKKLKKEPSYKKLYEGYPIDKPWNQDNRILIENVKGGEIVLANNPTYDSEQKIFADSNYDEVTGQQTFMNLNPIMLPENVKEKEPDKEFEDFDTRTGEGNQEAFTTAKPAAARRRASSMNVVKNTTSGEKTRSGLDEQNDKADVLQPSSEDSESDSEDDENVRRRAQSKKKKFNV